MTSRRTVFSWSPGGSAGSQGDLSSLTRRLAPLAADRTTDASLLARETAGALVAWLREPRAPEVLAGLPQALAAWDTAHAWRGPCAWLLAALGRALSTAETEPPGNRSRAVALELESGEVLASAEHERALARAAAESLSRGEELLVVGPCEAPLLALEEAWKAGREPRCLLGEGRPDLAGKRAARRLVRSGPRVTLTLDLALAQLLPRVDRVWIGTEAIAGDRFQGRLGDLSLLERAHHLEIPVELLATRATVLPGRALRPPTRPDEERELLWGDAPEGVHIEGAYLEALPLELVDRWIDEHGAHTDPLARASRDPIPSGGPRWTVPTR